MQDKLTYCDLRPRIAVYMGSRICVFNYRHNTVMYAYILPYNLDSDQILVKFGYTSDIIERYGTLKTEFRCSDISLIGLKLIRNKDDYLAFNKILTDKYAHQQKKIQVGSVKKQGVYWLSNSLLDEFEKINFVPDSALSIDSRDEESYFAKVSPPNKQKDDLLRSLMDSMTKQCELELELARERNHQKELDLLIRQMGI